MKKEIRNCPTFVAQMKGENSFKSSVITKSQIACPPWLKFSMFILDDALVVVATAGAHREFEYRVINRLLYGPDKTKRTQPPPISEEEFNKYGRDGWELCGIVYADLKRTLGTYRIRDGQLLFKRLKSVQ